MTRSRKTNAYSLGMDMWMLGFDSAMVIGMRTLKLAAGGTAADSETHRMIAEKLAAAAELPLVLATSGATSPEALTRSAVHHYSKKVRANRERLSGSSAKK
jgi:hypothetical protein